jgi:hypothetical protein
MAYNYSRGEQVIGDLKAADDAERDTKIDFEDNEIKFVTGDTQRVAITNAGMHVTGTADFQNPSGTEVIRISKTDDDFREIVFENNGNDIGGIYFNSAEVLFVQQADASNDLALRVGSTNVLRAKGATSRIGIFEESPTDTLDVGGGLFVSSSAVVQQNATVSGSLSFEDIIMAELSIPGVDLQTDTNAFRFNCPYGLTVTALGLALDQHTTSGDVTVTVTNTTDTNTMITLSLAGTSLGGSTTTVSNASCDQADVITFAITATPANAQGLRATLFFRRNI